jgi:hypothetical protein
LITLVSPPDRFEARQLYADCVREGLLKPARIGEAISLQLVAGAVMGFALDGRLIALMTATPSDLVTDGRPTLEISVCGRRADCAPHMLGLARLARLTLACWLQDDTVALCCLVKTGHAPGEKLARIGRFGRTAVAQNGLQLWTRLRDECDQAADLR